MADVVPAIIPETFHDIEKYTGRVAGVVSRVQVDVMDGQYAPEASWPYNGRDTDAFNALTTGSRSLPHSEELAYEIDMMVRGPEQYIDGWIAAGAQALIIHRESTEALDTIIPHLKKQNVEIGLAFKPSTPNADIDPWADQVDFIQCMGNDRIGFHGVVLDEGVVLGKIEDLRAMYPSAIISIDIGVNRDTAPKLVAAGANKLVSGSAIFGSGNVADAIQTFQSL